MADRSEASTPHPGVSINPSIREGYLRNIRKHWMLYVMILPGILFYIIFKYIPLGEASSLFRIIKS